MLEETAALSIHFTPLLSPGILIALAASAFTLLLISAFKFRQGLLWRFICVGAFILALLNPSLLEEEREPVPDVAVIVADKSPSQKNGKRMERMDKALQDLQTQLEKKAGLDVRVIETPGGNANLAERTNLFTSLDQTLADVPPSRRSGVIFLTDGQVHDIPQDETHLGDYGPVHALLTGEKDEIDRRLVIMESPAYGIVGQKISVAFKIEDSEAKGSELATIIVRENDGEPDIFKVPVNQKQIIELSVEHGGQNIFEIEAAPIENELSEVNNKAALLINGVRDRLKVLLVSGQPHAGGRTWRNMLTDDPGVDLVHFTILREPDKLDATPQNQLSLIAFPFRELFEIKLYDFDLIIFDRYRLNRILPLFYFSNISRYVREGGALLEASGPDYASDNSIYNTSLDMVLPGQPTGRVVEASYKPEITDLGLRHPVTENLNWGDQGWGPWLRQVAVTPNGGDVVMSGADDLPLLILNRVGEGRVAQLASDQIWLWSRGYQGGGPQADLLRRIAHWLMKEPELDENAMEARQEGETIIVSRKSLRDEEIDITLTRPDGTEETVTLTKQDGSETPSAAVPIDQPGIYRLDDGDKKRFIVIGSLNAPETRGIKTTESLFQPLTEATDGSVKWLSDVSAPDVRLLPPNRKYSGARWIGLRQNNDYRVTGVKVIPLLPAALLLGLLLTLCTFMWWREGNSA